MILLGCFVTALGVILLKHSHLVTGGTAGLSLNLAYFFHLSFAFVFFVINIPFYLFSLIQMGWRFTCRTILSVSILTLLTGIDTFLPAFTMPLLFGALGGGLLIGLGLTVLFTNGASLGGANILALFLQKKYSWNPGKVNLIFDVIVVFTGLYSIGIKNGICSIVSIVVISVVISCFKRQIAATQLPNQTKGPVMRHGVTTMQN
jgi:uncharacterized membrane-anchored protein YitT (DUF2179 family)